MHSEERRPYEIDKNWKKNMVFAGGILLPDPILGKDGRICGKDSKFNAQQMV